jgi:hypothetical protein
MKNLESIRSYVAIVPDAELFQLVGGKKTKDPTQRATQTPEGGDIIHDTVIVTD